VIRSTRPPRRREAPQLGRGGWEHLNGVLFARAAGRCEQCGEALTGDVERAHRQRRRDGGDRASNVLLVHAACHRWQHAHPQDAQRWGWQVSSYAGDPAAVPVRLWGGASVLLDDVGLFHPVAPVADSPYSEARSHYADG
jgi:hypothetical protein